MPRRREVDWDRYPQMMRAHHVADILTALTGRRYTKGRVYYHARLGRIPVVEIGKNKWFRKREVRALVEGAMRPQGCEEVMPMT